MDLKGLKHELDECERMLTWGETAGADFALNVYLQEVARGTPTTPALEEKAARLRDRVDRLLNPPED